MKIAFLGLGRMGRLMAGHVLDAGHELVVWNRTPGHDADLIARGAARAASPAQAAREADVVVSMLFGPESVREVLLDPDGVAAGARPGTLVVDSTSVGPQAARSVGTALAERGLRFVDAPVAGSLAPAAQGTLTVFAGGSTQDVERARPVLELWGEPSRVRHVGPVGAANALKLVVNLPLGITAQAMGEALALADDLGIDRDAALTALAAGPLGWFLGQKEAMVESGSYQPTSFSLELMAKDLALAVDASSGPLPAAAAALRTAQAATAKHGADDYAVIAASVRDVTG